MKKTKQLCRVIAMLMVVGMLAGLLLIGSVSATNSAVQDAAKGVLQINMVYTDDDNNAITLSYGSSFLINSNTIVTCAHCVDFTEADWAYLAEMFGKTVAQFKERISYTVTVTRDVTIPARLDNKSSEMDWAVLTLSSSLQNRTPLTLRSSSTVEATEEVFALGFPALVGYVDNINSYTSDDVTITSGLVNKVAYGANIFSGADYDFLQTSCKLSSGNSGGPMVDVNGYVVGVCEGAWGTGFQDDYFTAVCIDQVIVFLEDMGIQFDRAEGGSEPTAESTEPTSEAAEPATEATVDTSALTSAISSANLVDATAYSPESYRAVTEALDAAVAISNKAGATQAEVDRAASDLTAAMDRLQPAESGLSMTVILIIAAVAVIVIVLVIVIIVVSKSNKSNKKAPAPVQPAPRPAVPVAPAAPSGGFAPSQMKVPPTANPVTTAPAAGAGETTILNQGAGETTILSKSVNGGTLIRKRGGARIVINAAEFVIGRDRKSVSYCISDNTSISRVHAKLVVRDSVTYLVDQGAANGTFVNGVKANKNQEVALKSGDKITLADEEFEFVK